MLSTTSVPIQRFAALANSELLQRMARLEGGYQPARLFATSRPSFCRLQRVAVFRRDLGVFATRELNRLRRATSSLTGLIGLIELPKTFFQLPLLGGDLLRKQLRQLFVDEPKFLGIHYFEILPAHSIPVTVRLPALIVLRSSTGCEARMNDFDESAPALTRDNRFDIYYLIGIYQNYLLIAVDG